MRLTNKQRVQRRYPTAYAKRHYDLRSIWCLFFRKDDKIPQILAGSPGKLWAMGAENIRRSSTGSQK